jgi:hypothetical protein
MNPVSEWESLPAPSEFLAGGGEIAVFLCRAGKQAELRVRDTGTGIPAEEMPRLFGRFHRVPNARGRTHEGSGIGLALVQELVRLHGGIVTAGSAPGRGTTFTVALPLGSVHLPADQIRDDRSLAVAGVRASPFIEEALRWLPGEGAARQEQADALADHYEPVPVPCRVAGTGTAAGRPRVGRDALPAWPRFHR